MYLCSKRLRRVCQQKADFLGGNDSNIFKGSVWYRNIMSGWQCSTDFFRQPDYHEKHRQYFRFDQLNYMCVSVVQRYVERLEIIAAHMGSTPLCTQSTYRDASPMHENQVEHMPSSPASYILTVLV